MTDAPELKPCPFCGEAPSGVTCSSGDRYNYSIVSCATRGCRGNDDLWADDHDIRQAISAWNIRADLARPAPQPVGVKVKPLEWYDYKASYPGSVADMCGFHRRLEGLPDGKVLCRNTGLVYGDMAEAKGACQEAFQRHIAPALDPQPAMLSREEADAMVAAERARCKSALEQSAHNMRYEAKKPNGDPLLRFDLFKVRAALRDAWKYYAAALDHYGADDDAAAALQRQIDAAKAEGHREGLEEARSSGAIDRHAIARIITLDHLQLLSDFGVDTDLYRQDPECAESAYATADAILALIEKEG